MRRISLDRPFTGGMNTDAPAHEIGPQESVFAQDGFTPAGLFTQRQGWAFDGSVADVASNLFGVARVKFTLANVTRTLTSSATTIYSHNSAGAGTSLEVVGVTYLPRCVYKDELLFCGTDGIVPLKRYSGSLTTATIASGTPTLNAGEATITGMTLTSIPPVGSFLENSTVGTNKGVIYNRITRSSTTSLTLQGIRSSSTTSLGSFVGGGTKNFAQAWPAVGVYDKGTLSITTNVATGFGTDWLTGYSYMAYDSFLVIPPTGDATFGYMSAPTGETTFGTQQANQATKSAYQIMRSLPFRDVAAHKQSLWGTGVAQFPSRVYVGPPNWDLSFPPGFTLPFDPAASITSANANDFLMDFIDVPAPDDTDAVIAILESPNPLLVLKRKSVYGIFGSFGGLSADKIADGPGCIDLRSAKSYAEGQFWAGESGIYWYRNGRIIDLTHQDPDGSSHPKINAEWMELTRDFTYGVSNLDYCTLWLASDHLWVHITTASGSIQRTYICDIKDGSWQSRVTNVTPRYGWTSRIPGEREKALVVQDTNQGRVLNVSPCLDGSGTAKDGDGDSPRLQAWTTSALAQANGIDGIARMVDLDIHANVLDAGAAGATKLVPSVVTGGGIGNPADVTTALTAINSDTADRIDRASYRVAKQGRLCQVRLDTTPTGTDTNATKVEVAQIVGSFRDRRSRA